MLRTQNSPAKAGSRKRREKPKLFRILNFILGFYFFTFAFHLLCYAQVSEQAQAAGGEIPEEQTAKVESLVASDNVTLDFKEADIRNVLKIISYKSGVNIVITPEVMGNVTIRLVDVPWEKALDTIVKAYGFGYEWLSNKVIMVSTLEKLAQQRKAQQEAAEMEPLDTQAFVLNFSKADDIKTAIEKLVSPKGKITVESRTNTLIINDTKSNLISIGEIIKGLDKITPQVMIEAKLIETTLGSAEKLGIDWTIKVSATGSKRPTTLPWPDEYTGTGKKYLPKIQTPNQLQREATTTYNDAGVAIGTTYTENLYNKLIPGFPAVTADQFVFGTLDFSTFQAVLEVLKSRSSTKIISNPHITTLNNQEAKIFVGTTVSIPTYEYSKETGTQVISGYKDKEVGIKLVVIPNINEKSYITLNIKPNVDGITGFTGPSNQFPMISSRSAETKVMIKDGHTLVIGGLISENRIKSKKGIPILGDIPILDLIFGKREGIIEKTELLIFVTPHIIKEDESLLAETAQLEERLDSGPQEKATVSKKKKKN